MARLVGTERGRLQRINDLIHLDSDAIEAYEAAIERLEDAQDRAKLGEFLADHRRHVHELRELVVALGGKPVHGADVKRYLTKGKVVLGSLAGDRAVLLAMKSNEDDTNAAYERAISRDGDDPQIRPLLEKNLADERRHRAWIERRLGVYASIERDSLSP
jgi:uncharacterized protein (TIGR02284 family)